MDYLGGTAEWVNSNMPQQEQGPTDVQLQLTASVEQLSNSGLPVSTANEHASQYTERGTGVVACEARIAAMQVVTAADQQGHVDVSRGAQAKVDAGTPAPAGAPAAAALHSKQAVTLPHGMGASATQASTITQPRRSVLDCPMTFLVQLLQGLDSTSLLAMFQTCVWLRDFVLGQAHITNIIVRSLKQQSVKNSLDALQLARKHGSRVKLTFSVLEKPDVGRSAQELPTVGDAAITINYTDVLVEAYQKGITDCVMALELAGFELSSPLPGMVSLTCPNLTSLKLLDSQVWLGCACDDDFSAAFPKLQTLSFVDVALQGTCTGWQQKLHQQLARLTALESLSLAGSDAEPGEDDQTAYAPLCGAIWCALGPSVARQLTHLKLSWGLHDSPCVYTAWNEAGLAPYLTAVQVLHIHMSVDDDIMQQLLDLPSLCHLAVCDFDGGQHCFAGHACRWQTVQCMEIAVRDLAWLPLHPSLVITNLPGDWMDLAMWPDSASETTVQQALANISSSGWRGWHNSQVEVQVGCTLRDEESEAILVQALPLLIGISHLSILNGTNDPYLSSSNLLALARFAARQPRGFRLNIGTKCDRFAHCGWFTADIWPLVASMPNGSQLALYDVDEATFAMLCLFSTTSMTLLAANRTPTQAGFSARLTSSLAHCNRQAASVTARRMPDKYRWSWQWQVTMQAPSDGTQQFLTAQRRIMQQVMAQTGATETLSSPVQAVVSTAVAAQQAATTLSGMDGCAVVKKVCQPITGAEVLPLVDCPDSSLIQVLHTPDPASGLAILQTCPPSNDRVLRQADSIMIRSDLLDSAATQQALKALERASKFCSSVHLILDMLQQMNPATDKNQPSPDAIAGGEGNPVQLHAEEANLVQGSHGDTVLGAGQQQLQVNRRWENLLKGAHSMDALQCVTRLEFVGAELNAILPAAVGLTCPNVAVLRLQDSVISFDRAAEKDFSVAPPKLRALHLHDIQCRGGAGQGWVGQLRQQLTQLTALTSVTLAQRVHDPECEMLYSNVVHAVVPAATEPLTHLELRWYQYSIMSPQIAWQKSELSQHLASVCSLSVAMTVSDGVMQQLLDLPSLRHLEVDSFRDLMRSFAGHTCHWWTVRCSETGVKDLAWLPLHADMVIKARAGSALNLRLDSDVHVEQALANIKKSGWPGWQAAQVQMRVPLHDTASQVVMVHSLPVWAEVAHLNITKGRLNTRTIHKLSSFVASQAHGIHVELPVNPVWTTTDISFLVSSMPAGSRLTVHGVDEASIIHLCMSAQSSITICAKSSSPGRVGFLQCITSTMALWGQQLAEASIRQVHAEVDEGASWEWLVTVHAPHKKTELHILELYGEILQACMSA